MFDFLKNIFRHLSPTPKLHVGCDIGDKDSRTIILLHGIASSSNAWKSVVEGLNDTGCRIVTLDLLGFGQSPRPDNCHYTVSYHI